VSIERKQLLVAGAFPQLGRLIAVAKRDAVRSASGDDSVTLRLYGHSHGWQTVFLN
jgi:hypothetical protein